MSPQHFEKPASQHLLIHLLLSSSPSTAVQTKIQNALFFTVLSDKSCSKTSSVASEDSASTFHSTGQSSSNKNMWGDEEMVKIHKNQEIIFIKSTLN